eukprot:1535824-Pyramimonas_sp.AAC.1
MHQLISLNRKMGNHGHAAALQQRLDKRKAGSAPIPIQVQANQSDRARKALEKKLSNELEQFEKWQTWLADKKNSIHSLRQQLVEENDRYKKLVAQLQAEVAPPSSPPSSASLSLQDLLDGKQLFDATSVESFFNVDPEVYELGEEDRKQMAARAEDLSKRLVETTQNLFGAAAKQLEEARQLHKSHVSGLAKRRKAEGAAMPGGGHVDDEARAAGPSPAVQPEDHSGASASAGVSDSDSAARSSALLARAETVLGADFQPPEQSLPPTSTA